MNVKDPINYDENDDALPQRPVARPKRDAFKNMLNQLDEQLARDLAQDAREGTLFQQPLAQMASGQLTAPPSVVTSPAAPDLPRASPSTEDAGNADALRAEATLRARLAISKSIFESPEADEPLPEATRQGWLRLANRRVAIVLGAGAALGVVTSLVFSFLALKTKATTEAVAPRAATARMPDNVAPAATASLLRQALPQESGAPSPSAVGDALSRSTTTIIPAASAAGRVTPAYPANVNIDPNTMMPATLASAVMPVAAVASAPAPAPAPAAATVPNPVQEPAQPQPMPAVALPVPPAPRLAKPERAALPIPCTSVRVSLGLCTTVSPP